MKLGRAPATSSTFIIVIPDLLDILHYPSYAWREMGSVARFLSEEEGFWDVYRATTAEVPTRVNLVPDAHLAA